MEALMRLPFFVACGALAALTWVGACSGPPPSRSQNDAAAIVPLSQDPNEGTLILGVLGFPREIEYFVNGVRIEPDAEIPWWDDARLTLNLRPGSYSVEAKYRVRAFAGEKTVYRIVTAHPVLLRAGQTTYLLAQIEKDWRGVPSAPELAFDLVEGVEFERRVEEERATWTASSTETDAITTFRGSPDGDIEVERQGSGTFDPAEPETDEAAPSIVIRGNDVVPPGAAAPDSQAGPVGLPSAAEPDTENLADPSPSASSFLLSVLVESEPSGAQIFLDERAMGETPLRLSLDPLVNHVLRFQHENCSDHVQFISAESWERGRSATITTRLDCP